MSLSVVLISLANYCVCIIDLKNMWDDDHGFSVSKWLVYIHIVTYLLNLYKYIAISGITRPYLNAAASMKERLEVVEKSDMNDTYYSYYSALWIIATVYRMDHTIKYNMIDEDVLIVCTVHALMPLYVHISWMTSGWIGNQENQANTCLANMSSYVHIS